MSYLGNPLSTVDFPVDYFTGDGTSTTFQLSRIPASATSILVHIGGVKQVASTTDPAYYLDGSKLVFVSPPGAYSPIEVNYLGIAGQVNIPGVQSVTQDMLSLQLANTFVYQTTANGATASFTLNAPPVSANSLVVSANGVVQYDYSVNGTNLTFGFTPPVGTFIRVTSLALAQAGVPADGSVTSVKLGANLTITGNTTFDGFAGSPARIRGDFTNATIANRLLFQNSTDAFSDVGVLGGGSTRSSSWAAYFGNDPTNTSRARMIATSVDNRFESSITGSGTYLPLTMYTGGSERMRIDTSGNVGIGTTSPSQKLTVQGAISLNNSSGTGIVQIGDIGSTLRFQGRTALPITFWVSDLELMRIDGNGNVGVGVTPNTWTLGKSVSVGDVGSAVFGFGGYNSLTSGAYFNSGWKYSSSSSSQKPALFVASDGAFNWSTAAAGTAGNAITFVQAMTLDSNGNFGIGTSSPSYRLHVNTSAVSGRQSLSNISRTTGNWVRFTNPEYSADASMGLLLRVFPDSDARQGAGVIASGGLNNGETNLALFVSSGTASSTSFASYATSIDGSNVNNIFYRSAGTEAMRIDSSGNVGIGTNSPGSYAYGLAIDNANATNTGYVVNLLSAGSSWFKIGRLVASSTAILQSGQNLSLQPDSGNVGIGTSSPAMSLHVVKNWTSGKATVGAQTVTSFASGGIAGFGCFDSDGSRALYLYSNADEAALINGKNTRLTLWTNELERMRIDASGRITMPYQPAVEVSRTSNFAVTSNEAVGTVVPFSNETLDVGNNFDQGGTNRFTAPVAGKYQFHWSYGCNISNSTVYRTYLWINGTRREDSQLRNDNSKSGSAYSWGSRTLIISLSANDYVELRASSDTGTDFYADNNLRISMGITLIS